MDSDLGVIPGLALRSGVVPSANVLINESHDLSVLELADAEVNHAKSTVR